MLITKGESMKHLTLAAWYAVALSTLFVCGVHAEKRGIIDPIVPQSLRLEGESKRDMMKRLLDAIPGDSPMHPVRHHTHKSAVQKMTSAGKSAEYKAKKCACCKKKRCKNFKNFIGYWLLDDITYYSGVTVLEFFEDACGQPFARLFDGTQNHIRERNINDASFEGAYPITTEGAGDTFPVEILGAKSLRLLTSLPAVGEDDLRSTFRLQDADSNVGYAVFFSDSPEIGVDNLQRYLRLPGRPDIQLNSLPSPIDWTNPVEMFKYMVEYFALLGQPQKAVNLNQTDWIGWSNYEQLAQTMLTTGITRTAKSSTAYRGGQYIGVWRTQFPDDFPITTIHTQEVHQFNGCSTIEISGFVGAYAELNGTRLAATFPPSSLSESTPFPWQECSSRQPYIHIIYDSSHIEELYDPNIHGVATLTAHHGPITPAVGYRDYMAACLDFVISSFGPGTHTRLALWKDSLISVPETFEELKEALANDDVIFQQLRARTYVSNGFQVYWNPFRLGSPLTFPAFNLNDPFGLGLIEFDPSFDYDIPRQNYLEEGTVKNIFFTVTGPVLEEQPITGLLKDLGYTSNGSQVVFKAGDYQTFPAPLVDKFGTHPYMLFAGATNTPGLVQRSSQAFFGGIVKPELTGGKTVAYMRFLNEPGFDDPLTVLTIYPLVFGRHDIPNRFTNNFVAAWASLLEELNAYQPERYILDIRNNGGGFVINSAIASLFGGDRQGGENNAEAFPGNGQRAPVLVAGSGIQTVFDSVPAKPYVLPTDVVAQVFPKSAVRDRDVEVIILDSTRSASSGDVFPHGFIGPDEEGTVQDLGRGVKARIIGDIDGRLWTGFKGFDALPIDPLSQNLVDGAGNPVTANYMVSEGGLMAVDRHGIYVNEKLYTRPNPLLHGWYDQTEWQDLGLTPVIENYPLGDVKDLPTFEDPSTWRDVWLENAIVN